MIGLASFVALAGEKTFTVRDELGMEKDFYGDQHEVLNYVATGARLSLGVPVVEGTSAFFRTKVSELPIPAEGVETSGE